MDQILNELSVTGEYLDRYAANMGMQQLLSISKDLTTKGFHQTIRTTQDFINRHLGDNFTIREWATEKTSDINQRDFQRYFLTLATKAPYIEYFIADDEQDDRLVEYKHNLGVTLAIGLADLWNAPVLSLGCSDQFQLDYVSVVKTTITEDGENDQDVEVLNLWRTEQIIQFNDELNKTAWQSVNNGKDIINQAANLLPHLSISENASYQIEDLSGSEQFFPEVLRHLVILNKTMDAYTEGAFNPVEINWSVESSSTLKQFSECRKFNCLDGQKRLFSQHSKILSANKRIYFLPILDENTVHIGYVGKHLPTKRFRT